MRPLKGKKQSNRISISKGHRSNKKIPNIFKNKTFLIDIWQLFSFSSIATFLIFTYLNQAWSPINSGQVEITGLSSITENNIRKATNIFFPKNLLELNPKEIEAYLMKKLPLKGISVSRNFFPPGIHINIVEREPVAFASRVISNRVENGMIDIEGNWIPINYINQSNKNKINIHVEGWNLNNKDDIISILKNRFTLSSALLKIKVNPLQEIAIETKHFNSVLLGANTDRLREQINKLNQLQKTLPNLLINTKVKTVDLKDPDKPELKTEKILEKES